MKAGWAKTKTPGLLSSGVSMIIFLLLDRYPILIPPLIIIIFYTDQISLVVSYKIKICRICQI